MTDVPTISWADFEKVDIRVGKIISVEDFPEARKPAYKLTIDFGEKIGTKQSSAQITSIPKDELLGELVAAVTNFPPKQIGPFVSEVLTLGFADSQGNWIVVSPKKDVQLGGKLS
jgi:tRNA-binding protein